MFARGLLSFNYHFRWWPNDSKAIRVIGRRPRHFFQGLRKSSGAILEQYGRLFEYNNGASEAESSLRACKNRDTHRT